MECTINWMGTQGMSFVAETGSGHLLTMDGAPRRRGAEPGPPADGDRAGPAPAAAPPMTWC